MGLNECHLTCAQRFDNYTSTMSDPVRTISECVEALGVGRVKAVVFSRRAWQAAVNHSTTTERFLTFQRAPRVELRLGPVRFTWHDDHPTREEMFADLLCVPRAAVRVVDLVGAAGDEVLLRGENGSAIVTGCVAP